MPSVTSEPIRESDEYRGFRVRLMSTLASAVVRLQLDIALDDVVTPPALMADLPSILGDMSLPRRKVYPPETIVAETLHAIVKLGIANSRMKDFFDLYVLARERMFAGELLARAVMRTFLRRALVASEARPGVASRCTWIAPRQSGLGLVSTSCQRIVVALKSGGCIPAPLPV